MEIRRLLLFFVLSMAILVGWQQFVVPLIWGVPKPAAQQNVDEKDKDKPADEKKDDKAAADKKIAEVGPAEKKPDENKPDEKAAQAEKGAAQAAPAALPDKLQTFDEQEIKLGSLEPGSESSYFLLATVASRGAALKSVEFNDPRYHDLVSPQTPLKILGSLDEKPVTFETSVESIDEQLKKYNTKLSEVIWQVESKEADPAEPGLNRAVVLKYVSPDGKLELRKRYAVNRVNYDGQKPADVRDLDPKGYEIDFSLTVKNLSSQEQTLTYVLQGPSGLPLEDPDNTRKYRDVKMGYFEEGELNIPLEQRTITAKTVAASNIASEVIDQKPAEEWKRAFKYLGIDVQYFTALVLPGGDQLKDNYLAEAGPQVIGKPNAKAKEKTDITLDMTSKPVTVAAGQEFSHSYSLFVGPKREKLLAALCAEKSLDFGWFGFVSKPLTSLLKFLNSLGFPYGIAIIILTIIVRACMFPVSLHQNKGAQKMKEMAPLIAELKKKYANDKEKFARAQMELFSKHNYNVFGGCLPLFLQLPIFMGLYQALGNAVDLRAAKFLWIDNLAAPDALFRLPFTVPWVEWKEFNLLPIITIVLFIVQQKMFMPPPAPDDEQAKMQQKMMKYMMIVMGFMFYRVPAGLCVYFIASSLWGMGERKLLDLQKKKLADNPPPTPEPEVGEGKRKYLESRQTDKQKPERQGLWAKLVASAEAAAEQSKTNTKSRSDRDGKNKKKKSRR